MAITYHPIIGYQNLVDHSDTILTASGLATGSNASNLKDPNLGVVAAFAAAQTPTINLDFGQAKSVGGFMVRFRDNAADVDSVRFLVSATSDHADPLFDQTYSAQIPSAWSDVGIPERPVYRAAFDAVSGRYARIVVTRTTGTGEMTIARAYVGPVLQLDGIGNGYAAYASAIEVESTTTELTGDRDTDFRFVRGPRRIAKIKVEGVSDDQARREWQRKLLYAAASADSLYIYDPLETEPNQLQFETVWGKFSMEQITAEAYNVWEGNLTARERL